jgi:uncharacterized protein (DUF2141 family)
MLLFSACKQKKQDTEETEKETVEEKVEEKVTMDSIPEEKSEVKEETADTASKSTKIPLRLIVDNLKTSDGEIEVGVYTPKNKFPDEDDKFKKYRFKAKKGKIDEMITDIPYGELAMAIYHDENNNGKIDKNAIGIPKEPYAFSNNYKPTIKAPNFDNCKFSYNKKSSTVKISMLK